MSCFWVLLFWMMAFQINRLFIPRYLNSRLVKWDSGKYTIKQLCNHFSFTSLKLTKLMEHQNYLLKAEATKCVPKGMLKLSPVTIGICNIELLNTIRKNDYESAINFMKIYKEFYPSEILKFKNKLFKLRNFLRNILPRYLFFDLWRNVQSKHIFNSNSFKKNSQKEIGKG